LSNATNRNILSTKSKQIDHDQFILTSSKARNFTKNYSFDIVFVKKQHSAFSKESFDVAAGVDGALRMHTL